MDITYYVVVPFDRDADGSLAPGEAAEAPNASAAARKARMLSLSHAGALAFSRSGDPAAGEFRDAVVLAEFGEVERGALSA